MPPLPFPAGHVMSYADFQTLRQPAAHFKLGYGADPLQHVELWYPDAAPPYPVVILVHGGCWQTSVANTAIMRRMAEALTHRGVAVWNIEYRGVDVPGGGYPGTFHDVAAATELLRDRGASLNLDTDRVIAVGHSAGGHLALWLAGRHRIGPESTLRADHPIKVLGVVSLGGLPDLAEARLDAADACGLDTVDKLVGSQMSARADPFADTSPVALAPLGVRQVMIAGAEDTISPPRYSERYAEKGRMTGDHVDVTIVPDQGHFELITPGTPAGDAAVDAIMRMLDAFRR